MSSEGHPETSLSIVRGTRTIDRRAIGSAPKRTSSPTANSDAGRSELRV